MLKSILALFFFIISVTVIAQSGVDLVVQSGHSDVPWHVAWSKDGKYIATACTDGSVKLWDAKMRLQIHNWFVFAGYAKHVAFSDDGKLLVGVGPHEAMVWDVRSGKKIAILYSGDDEQKSETEAAVFSPDGKYLYMNLEDFSIRRVDVAELLKRREHAADEDYIEEDSTPRISNPETAVSYTGMTSHTLALKTTPGNRFLIAAEEKQVFVWDVASGNIKHTITSAADIRDLEITPDGKWLFIIDDNAQFKQFDIVSGKLISTLQLELGAKCLRTSNNGKTIAIGNYLRKISLYDVSLKKVTRSFAAHSNYITALAFNEDGNLLASGGADKSLKIWETRNGSSIAEINSIIFPVDKLLCNDARSNIATLSSVNGTNRIISWEISKGISVKNGSYGKPRITLDDAFFFSEGQKDIVSIEDSAIVFRNLQTGNLTRKIHAPYVTDLTVSDDGRMMVYYEAKQRKLYKRNLINDSTAVITDYDSARSVFSLTISPNGRMLAVAEIGSGIRVIDMATGKTLHAFNYVYPEGKPPVDSTDKDAVEAANYDLGEMNAWVYDVKFSPDNKEIAASCRFPDPLVHGSLMILWKLETGEMSGWINAHIYPMWTVNWSADGKYLVTTSNDKAVKVWDHQKIWKSKAELEQANEDRDEPVHTYTHDFTSKDALFTNDQQWIISAGIDGKIIVKDAADYRTLATLISLDTADYVAVTPEQYYAASKEGVKLISFRQGNQIMPASQFDIRYNRPDKVLEALGSKDTLLIRSYKRAYEKRIRKLGIDTTSFTNNFSRPELVIKGSDTVKYSRTSSILKLQLSASTINSVIDRFNVWVNDVPVYGSKGIVLRTTASRNWDTTVTITLSSGENRIEASVIDANGTESYRYPLFVRYQPIKQTPKKFYFIGIGINAYQDSAYNLRYSVKDIRDLARKFKEKYAGAIIDTLFDKNVTKENILAIHQKLMKLDVDDKVVLSYSGHGLFSKDYDYFLSTHTIDFSRPEQNGLSYDELESLIDDIQPRQKLVFIDACHSGEVDKDELESVKMDSLPSGVKGITIRISNKSTVGVENSFELMKNIFVNVSKGTGTTVISAAAGTQFAQESGDLKNGVFTYSVLEALKKNPHLKVSALKKYVGARVKQLTNGLQVPTSRNETTNYDWEVW